MLYGRLGRSCHQTVMHLRLQVCKLYVLLHVLGLCTCSSQQRYLLTQFLLMLSLQAWEPAHKALPSRRFVSGSKDNTIRVWDANTRRCLFSMSSHTMVVTCVRWGGEGLIYSSSRDCSINVWDANEGKLVRTLKGHGHWVNTLALSTESVLRTGAFDHTGRAPEDPQEAMKVCGIMLGSCCQHLWPC